MVLGPDRDVEAAQRAAVQAPAVAARPRIGAFLGAARRRAHGRRRRPRRPRSAGRAASNSTARSRSISAVSRSAFANDALRTTRRRNATLVCTPTMWVCASAASSRASASRAVAAVHDQLRDHRVVVRRDRVAFAHAAVDPHLRVGAARELDRRRQPVDLEPAGRRQEAGVGVLGRDARLDRMAVDRELVLGQRQRLRRRRRATATRPGRAR